jgi:ATP-dependent DNA helicase RecQ
VVLRTERTPVKPARERRDKAGKDKPGKDKSGTAADTTVSYDSDLFEKLRAWRAAAAKEQGVPAYVIFHDATLRQIAAALPADLAGLSAISGVGETKLARYGEQILAVLAPDS